MKSYQKTVLKNPNLADKLARITRDLKLKGALKLLKKKTNSKKFQHLKLIRKKKVKESKRLLVAVEDVGEALRNKEVKLKRSKLKRLLVEITLKSLKLNKDSSETSHVNLENQELLEKTIRIKKETKEITRLAEVVVAEDTLVEVSRIKAIGVETRTPITALMPMNPEKVMIKNLVVREGKEEAVVTVKEEEVVVATVEVKIMLTQKCSM